MKFLTYLVLATLFLSVHGQLSFYDDEPIYEGSQNNNLFSKYAISYDVNNDNISDILHFQNNELYVLYGDGNKFGNEELVYQHTASFNNFSNLVDINNDDRLDFAITTSNGEMLVFKGTNEGLEETIISASANSVHLKIPQIVDINSDGLQDLVFNTSFGLYYMLGNEEGTFNNSILIDGIENFGSVFRFDVTDIDGDNDNDLIVLDIQDQILRTLLNNDLEFELGPSINSIQFRFSSGDFNLDGIKDMAVINSDNELEVYLLKNNEFELSHTLSTFNISSIISYDYNMDGREDLLLSDRMTNLSLITSKGDGTFNDPDYIIDEMPRFSNPSFTDFNDDGIDDILAFGSGPNNQLILIPLNPQVQSIDKFDVLSLAPDPGHIAPTHIADLDKDGHEDLVVFSENGAIYVYYGTNLGFSQAPEKYPSNVHTKGGFVEDVNDDGYLDFIVYFQSSSNGTIGTEKYINETQREFSDVQEFKSLFGVTQAIFENYDNNATNNFIASNFEKEIVFLTVDSDNSAEYYTQNPLKLEFDNTIKDFQLKDINNDGWKDLLVAVFNSPQVYIYVNNQLGGFDEPISISLESHEYPTAVNSVDLDNDSFKEIIVAVESNTSSQSKAKIYSRQSLLSDFTESHSFDINSNFGSKFITIQDFDGDADLDIFFNDFDNLQYSFITQTDDGWVVKSDVLESFGQSSVNITDLNSDGFVDLVRTQIIYGSFQITFNNSILDPSDFTSEIVSIEQVDQSLKFTLNQSSNNGRLVLAKEGGEVDATPTDGIFYAQNSNFGVGSELGDGNYVVYSGDANEFVIDGLSTLTDYHISIFEYNSNTPNNSIINYLTTDFLDSMVAVKEDQSLVTDDIKDRFITEESFDIGITSSAGLEVDVTVLSGPITIVNGVATISGLGDVVIHAIQEGNKFYYPIEETYRFTISKEPQILDFANFGDVDFEVQTFEINITSSSGLPVDFELISGPIQVEGNIATITDYGTVVIRANQEGNDLYLPIEELFTFDIVEVLALSNDSFEIYPNPVTDYLTIKNLEMSGLENMKLIDIQGKVYPVKQVSSETIDLRDLHLGNYVLQIKINDQILNYRIIKR